MQARKGAGEQKREGLTHLTLPRWCLAMTTARGWSFSARLQIASPMLSSSAARGPDGADGGGERTVTKRHQCHPRLLQRQQGGEKGCQAGHMQAKAGGLAFGRGLDPAMPFS